MSQQFIVSPAIGGDVEIGPAGPRNHIYLGRTAETGPFRKVFFNAGKEFVLLVLGKRGSGKSYTLGGLIEGFCTTSDKSSISDLSVRPGLLLLDPMANFWTSVIPASETGTARVREQHRLLEGWNCQPEPSSIRVWLPAGFVKSYHHGDIQAFSVRAADLDLQDLADLVNTNLVSEPQGMLLGEVHEKVTVAGWEGAQGRKFPPKTDYNLTDLVQCLEESSLDDHRKETARALLRTLRSLARQPVFQGRGTSLTELIKPGSVSILMLPQSVGHDLRRVATRVLIRRLLKEREIATHIRQRLDLESIDGEKRAELSKALEQMVPKTVLAIDEAQELLGEDGGEAREALEDFCLLGRNYGLSLMLATQRPTAMALSSKVRAQVDTYLIHQLLTQEDIDITHKNLVSPWPQSVRVGDTECDFSKALRRLAVGHCIVASARMSAKATQSRAFFMEVRPRTRVHGGEVS